MRGHRQAFPTRRHVRPLFGGPPFAGAGDHGIAKGLAD